MKPYFKIFGALILPILLFNSCEQEDLDTSPSELLITDEHSLRKYNNGMIKSYGSETIIEWNELLGSTIDERLPQPLGAKIYAMVTIAMHDALNNVVPKYHTYALDNSAVDASFVSKKNIQAMADATISQAARDVMVFLFPPSQPGADEKLNQVLSTISDEDSKQLGISIGKDAASAILIKRQGDFPLEFETFTGKMDPGDYQANFMPWMIANPPRWPANAVYAYNLGDLTPFGIVSGDQFRDEDLYPLNSQNYIDDYNEVKLLGCTTCTDRTAEQTEIGFFWIENTTSMMNRIARTLIVEKELNGWEAARLIALIEMSQIDAYIASFEGKRFFNFWRPITAVRAGDFDGVDGTIGDVNWTPIATTPPTPEYPSTHSYCGGAAAAVFQSFFGTDEADLIATSPYHVPGTERHVTSFSQISQENAESRIYVGYHFRHAIIVGQRQGKELGKYVFENNLKDYR
ncbi:vanadium-dependent haloperoxidase [Aegicerativicinus sediminis]